MNAYRTIAGAGSESLYTEKRSRFIGRAFPASSVEDAMGIVAEVKKEYNDARHVAWAYRLGTDDEATERASDDGEPSGSAGKPILGQIISRDLRNVAVTVVRYYGGVNLGTGGLAVAYKTAAGDALDLCEVRPVTLYARYRLRFPFDLINPVMMLLRSTGAETEKSDTDTEGYLWDIRVTREGREAFEKEASALYRLSLTLRDEKETPSL